MAKKLTSAKAKEILHDKSVHGKPLTEKQRKFFGAIAGGAKPYKAEDGGWLDRYEEGGVLKQKTTDNYGTKPNANNSDVSLPPGFVGLAYNTKGRNYSPAWGGQFQNGGKASADSVRHQANKILQYEQLRGGPGGTPLPYYSDPKYMNMLMGSIYPEVKKILPNASAIEAGEAMDFVFNAGWDQSGNKITKDPRAYALQEYYRQNDPSKLDADGKWSGRKNPAYSFDQEYNATIGKLPENERRIFMNKGRDWYYKNINNPSPGVPNSNYYDTWYGRIWNTNDYQPFNPNNPKFIPKKQDGGNLMPPMAGANQTVPMAQLGDSIKPIPMQLAMGGSLPGATGMMYARTINPAPSNGPYAKKTKASAQNGQEMKFYQEGLDFTPKTISQDGLKLIPRATGDLRGPKIDPRMSANIAATQQKDKQEKANTTYEALRNNPALKLYSDDELVRLAKNPSKWPKHVSDAVNYENVTKTLIENNPNYNPELSLEEQRGLASDNSLKTRMLRGKNLLRNYDYSNNVPVLGTAMNLARDIMTAPGAVASNVMFPQQRYVEPFTRGNLQGVAEGATNVLSDVIDVADVGAPAALTKGVIGGLKGLGLMSKGVGLKAMTAAPLLFYKKSGTVDPINVSTFTESVNRVKELIETPAAREAFRNVGEQIASTRGLAQADPAYAAAITNPNLPMQTIDEMARVLTEVDPSKVSFTKQQRNYIKELGDVAIDVGRTTGFRDDPRSAQWLLENTQNLSARDVVPFLYGLNIPENQKIQMLNRLYDTRRGSTVANPIAEYTAARDLFSLAENYRDIPEALRLRGVLGEPRFGSNFLGNQLRRGVVDMAVKAKNARQQFELSDAYSMYRGNISSANDIFPSLFRSNYANLPTAAQRAAAKDVVSRRILERRSEVFGDPSNIGKTFIGSGSMSADSYEMAMRAIPMAERLNAIPVPMSNDIGSIFTSYANESAGIVQANDVRQQYLDRVQQTLGKRNLSTLNQDDLNLVLAYRDPINPRLLKNLMIESKMANSAISDVNRAIGSNIPAARLNDVSGIQRPLIGLIPQGGGAPREMRLTTRPTTSNITSFEQEDVQPLTITSIGQIRDYVNRMRPGMQLQDGGNVDPMGYWNPDNWGKAVTIPSNEITMQGVDVPLVGISDTGDVQYMEPGEDYTFDGDYVTEYPVAKKGISVNNADAQPVKKLDQSLNFTNYNKPTKGGWLDKYQ